MVHQAEDDATTARRMAAMSHAIRREVLRAPSREALLRAACNVAVENGGLRLAWVGWLVDGAMVPQARAGHDDGYVDTIAPALLTQPSQGPTARSLLNDQAAYTDDFQTDPRMAPWRELAGKHGLVSSAALPLHLRGQVVGTLNIYSGERGMFRGETRAVLEALADDISFTLDRLQDVVDRESARADYRLLFEQAAVGIFLADAQGNIIDSNPAAAQIVGFGRDELRRMTFADLLPSLERPPRLDELKEGAPLFQRRRLLRKDGREVEVEIGSTRLSDGRVQGVVRDVTERNRLMAELVQADRLAAVGRLAAGIAHEVNNPLAYAVLNLSLLVRHLGGEAVSLGGVPPVQLAKDAMEGAERVADIVRDLRAMTRVRDERAGPVDLREVAESALRIAGHQVRRRANVVTELKACRPVYATRARLEQVVINLLVNAAQAIEPAATDENAVTLRVYEEKGAGVLEVTDTGAGIPAAVQARIFDPFFTTRGAGEGTGLGLAISHNLVSAVGGRLTFTTAEGRGTTFRVEVPLAKQAEVTAPEAAPGLPGPLTGLRVLVVDDEAGIRHAMVRLLPRCAVVTAASVDEALAALAKERFDVVLSDVLMPGATAAELLSALRKDHAQVLPRVVFMTGAAGDDAVRSLLESVDAPVLEKPFDAESLARALRRVLPDGDGS